MSALLGVLRCWNWRKSVQRIEYAARACGHKRMGAPLPFDVFCRCPGHSMRQHVPPTRGTCGKPCQGCAAPSRRDAGSIFAAAGSILSHCFSLRRRHLPPPCVSRFDFERKLWTFSLSAYDEVCAQGRAAHAALPGQALALCAGAAPLRCQFPGANVLAASALGLGAALSPSLCSGQDGTRKEFYHA